MRTRLAGVTARGRCATANPGSDGSGTADGHTLRELDPPPLTVNPATDVPFTRSRSLSRVLRTSAFVSFARASATACQGHTEYGTLVALDDRGKRLLPIRQGVRDQRFVLSVSLYPICRSGSREGSAFISGVGCLLRNCVLI